MYNSYSITQSVSLPPIAVQVVNDLDKESAPTVQYETIGGVLSDTKHAWLANGSKFMVVNCKSGAKVAAWTFGSVVKDNTTKVVCVDELDRSSGKLPLLVIGLQSNVAGGMICVFDMIGSRILRAIQVEEKITSLHVVDASYEKCPLPGPLRAFDGILAVGVEGGNALLIDLCRQVCDEAATASDYFELRNEVNPCSLKIFFQTNVHSIELYKQRVLRDEIHVAVHLNAVNDIPVPHFVLKGPIGDDRVYVNKSEVVVSALHYCAQLGSLLVGYNFGAWQLWNLISLDLVYTSPIYEENIPVTNFAIQEPSDDPKAFCYVWVIYSNMEPFQTGFPLAVMYSLNYEHKEWHEGYGFLYQNLNSCSVRFQSDVALFHDLHSTSASQGARCLRLQAVTKCMSKGGSLYEHQEELVTLCCIVWNSWSLQPNSSQHTYISVFDLNQWYKEQMPNSIRLNDCEAYMTNVCLTKLLPSKADLGSFLDIRLDANTLTQFTGSQKLEEHYHPASYAFEFYGLRENDIIFYNNQGSQRALLSFLETNATISLLKPTEMFHKCIELGLYPLFLDIPLNLGLDDQRNFLLSVALEQHLTSFLCKCASVWSTGIYSNAGCSLQFLVSWGWQRALVLKQNTDKLSTPLFDYSGIRLDANSHNLLSNSARQIKNLTLLFEFLTRKFSNFFLNLEVVKLQYQSLQMASIHLEVLQWLLNVGLLPECPLTSYPRADEFSRVSAPYPVESLKEYYDERRTTLQTESKEHFLTKNSLLFIDNLIELECGGIKIQKLWYIISINRYFYSFNFRLWEDDGGTGLYPPPSLQALLQTYLIEGIEISVKHCIVVYVFLDLAMTLDQIRYKSIITNLIKFPAVFQLSPSIIKVTQAFWQLDHGDISTAMEQLLDPLINAKDLKTWHHRVALNALLCQSHYKLALLYFQVRQPPLTDLQDLCMVISLFITNNMMDEAFHFQRQNRNPKNEEKLLQYFFKECDRKGIIASVIHLNLTPVEETTFIKYLKDIRHPKKEDLEVFYHVQHSRYMEALELNDKFKFNKFTRAGLIGQDHMGFRDLMINEFTNTLPEVTKRLIQLCKEESSDKRWKEVERPEPLSVVVHVVNNRAKYKSSVIENALSKAKETWIHPILNEGNERNRLSISEQMPFLNTPKALKPQSRTTTPIIFPKIIDVSNTADNDEPPSKKFKVSPRSSLNLKELQKNANNITCTNISIRLHTPIIKRRSARSSPSLRVSDEKFITGTPQSILKVSQLMHNNSQSPDREVVTPECLPNVIADRSSTEINQDFSARRALGIMPRKSLPRTPRPAVRFEMSRESSESSVASERSHEIICNEAAVHSQQDENDLSTKSLTVEIPSKNSSLSTEDTFYSPNNSGSVVNGEKGEVEKTLEDVCPPQPSPRRTRSFSRNSNIDIAKEVDEAETVNESKLNLDSDISPKTPRSRRSYRGVSVRSSPRIKRSLISEEQKCEDIATSSLESLRKTPLRETPITLHKAESLVGQLRGRRSLTREVLEKSTFSKITTTVSQSLSDLDPLQKHISFTEKEILKKESHIQTVISEISEPDKSPAAKLKSEVSENNELLKNDKEISEHFNVEPQPLQELFTQSEIFELEDNGVLPNPNECQSITGGSLKLSASTDDLSITQLNEFDSEDSQNTLQASEGKDDLNTAKYDISFFQQTDDESSNQESAKESAVVDKDIQSRSTELDIDGSNKVTHFDEALKPVDESEVNIYEDLSNDNYTSADPQLNVFEVSDDLDLNKAMLESEDADIMEIDSNYNTYTDDDVFADKSEILADVDRVVVETITDANNDDGPTEQPWKNDDKKEVTECIELSSDSEDASPPLWKRSYSKSKSSSSSIEELSDDSEVDNLELEEVEVEEHSCESESEGSVEQGRDKLVTPNISNDVIENQSNSKDISEENSSEEVILEIPNDQVAVVTDESSGEVPERLSNDEENVSDDVKFDEENVTSSGSFNENCNTEEAQPEKEEIVNEIEIIDSKTETADTQIEKDYKTTLEAEETNIDLKIEEEIEGNTLSGDKPTAKEADAIEESANKFEKSEKDNKNIEGKEKLTEASQITEDQNTNTECEILQQQLTDETPSLQQTIIEDNLDLRISLLPKASTGEVESGPVSAPNFDILDQVDLPGTKMITTRLDKTDILEESAPVRLVSRRLNENKSITAILAASKDKKAFSKLKFEADILEVTIDNHQKGTSIMKAFKKNIQKTDILEQAAINIDSNQADIDALSSETAIQEFQKNINLTEIDDKGNTDQDNQKNKVDVGSTIAKQAELNKDVDLQDENVTKMNKEGTSKDLKISGKNTNTSFEISSAKIEGKDLQISGKSKNSSIEICSSAKSEGKDLQISGKSKNTSMEIGSAKSEGKDLQISGKIKNTGIEISSSARSEGKDLQISGKTKNTSIEIGSAKSEGKDLQISGKSKNTSIEIGSSAKSEGKDLQISGICKNTSIEIGSSAKSEGASKDTNSKENIQLDEIIKEWDSDKGSETSRKSSEKTKIDTPARRSRRLSSLQPTAPSDELPTRRSASFNTPTKTEEVEPHPSTPSEADNVRCLRRRSIDLSQTSPKARKSPSSEKEAPIRKRVLRSIASSDLQIKDKSPVAKKRARRAQSLQAELPVIKEESKRDYKRASIKSEAAAKQKFKKALSTVSALRNKIESYSTSRRLTRRQAGLLAKVMGTSTDANVESEKHEESYSNESDDEMRGPQLAEIDPIHLLDKASFEGKKDSDEERNMQKSPSSSIVESPIGSQRQLRSRSASNVSPENSEKESLKFRSAKRALVSMKTRQRSKSTDETKPDNLQSPPKLRRLRKSSKEDDSNSDISTTTSLSLPTKLRRQTRKVSLLDKILEEQPPSSVEKDNKQSGTVKPARRTLRKRSNAI